MKRLNKIFILFGLSLLIFLPQSLQAKKVAHKLNKSESEPIKIKVIYGEKITLFSINKNNNSGHVEFSNNFGAKDSKDISLKDLEFLKNKLLKISGISNDRNFCTRNYITITFNGQDLVGCIGAPNSFAREVQEITNLLSILF